MNKLIEKIKQTKLGDVQAYKNMKILSIMGLDSKLDYLTLDDALRSGLMITETGSVPTLHFTNKTGKEILLLQGEYVVGGKQNRMLAANVYMAKDFDGNVPVNCVEQGRWNYGYTSDYDLSNQPINAKFSSSDRIVSRAVMFAATKGQGDVWSEINHLSNSHNVHSSTQNLDEVFKQKQGDINDYLSKFSYVAGSIGMVVALEKDDGFVEFGLDLFDQSKTLERNFRKILESYTIDAIKDNDLKIGRTKKDAKEFLEGIDSLNFQERKAVSLGNDYLLVGTKGIYNGLSVGFALEYIGEPLYVSFTNRKPSNKSSLNPWNPRPDNPWIRPQPFPDSYIRYGRPIGGGDFTTGQNSEDEHIILF